MIDPRWQGVRRLLVMRPDNIGDVILTSPVLRALKAAWPGGQLTMLVSKAGALALPLLPWVDASIVARPLWQDLHGLPFDPARERAFVETLREGAFDAAILLTSFSQSPHPPALMAMLAGIPLRLGESVEVDAGLLTDAPAGRTPPALHQAERNLRLIEAIGVPAADRRTLVDVPELVWQASRQWRRDRGVLDRGYVVLVPYASCSARTYDPVASTRAAMLVAQSSGLRVVVTGTEADAERAGPLLDMLGPAAVDAVGATDLAGFAALIAGARLVMTNNTSALHLADALGVPVLATYAGTDLESQWAPRAAPARLLRRPTACSPCYLLTCAYEHQCLDYTPEAVAEAGLALLEQCFVE